MVRQKTRGGTRYCKRGALTFLPLDAANDGGCSKKGLFVDVETSGLDPRVDRIIELAMMPFEYTLGGEVLAVGSPFRQLEDPGIPLSSTIVALTGITDEHVRGERIDDSRVLRLLRGVQLVVAHNAEFDRAFLEPRFPVFRKATWGCSIADVPWRREGVSGISLMSLARRYGITFQAHRAVNDCRAGIQLLTQTLPRSKVRVLSALLESLGTVR